MKRIPAQWNDPVICILAIGMALAVLVSSTPTYIWIALFHTSEDTINWFSWGVFLSIAALVVFEGGGIVAKLMTIWAEEWAKNLTIFMVVFLSMLTITNFASGWDSIHKITIEETSIYYAIRKNDWATGVAVFFYAASFPVLQGLFMTAFVQRWKAIEQEQTENEILRNEIDQLKAGFEIEKNEVRAFVTYLKSEQTNLVFENATLKRQLQEIPIPVEVEQQVVVAGRTFTTKSFAALLNDWLMKNHHVSISETSVWRMIEKTEGVEK